MAEKVNFKLGGSEKFDTIESKEQGTLYAVNEAFAETPGDSKQGSIYLGDKLLGTSKANELRTVNPITVTEGSPIDAMGLFPDNIIPAGTTVEDLFKRLVSVEIYPTTTIAANGSFSVTLGAPTISANVSNKAVVEIGSKVKFSSIKSGSDSISKTAAKVSGFSYGYKDSLEGDKVDAKEIVSDWSSTPSGVYSLTATVEGFSALSTSSVSADNAADAKIENQEVTVAKGPNKLTVKGTGKSYQATREAIASKFIISNSNGVSEKHKSQEVDGVSQSYTDADGNSATFEVTGVYPVYNNIADGSFAETPGTRFGLTTGSSFEVISVPSEVAAGRPLMIDYPASKSVSSFQLKDPSGKWAAFSGNYTADSIGEFDKDVNGLTIKYKRFKLDGSNGAGNDYKITFNSGMNS